jgi:hypothetical protein
MKAGFVRPSKADESVPDLHLEYSNSTEAVMGWSRDLCIQLASIHFFRLPLFNNLMETV